MPLEVLELDPKKHDRARFECGDADRDHYLKRFASQHQKHGVSKTFVLVDSNRPREILGFYSASAAQADINELAGSDRRGLSRRPVPAVRVGQLAVATEYQGQGHGALLLGNAVKRALAVRNQSMGIRLVIVDAASEQAAEFYRKYGFKDCSESTQMLYLSLGR